MHQNNEPNGQILINKQWVGKPNQSVVTIVQVLGYHNFIRSVTDFDLNRVKRTASHRRGISCGEEIPNLALARCPNVVSGPVRY